MKPLPVTTVAIIVLLMYTSSMTPFGANDSTLSQTKRFSTLMSLNTFHRNKNKTKQNKKKKRKKGSPLISCLSQSLITTFSRVDLLGRRILFLSCSLLNLYHFLLPFSHLS